VSTIRETDLPGIGRKFQVEARSGDKLVIVVHDDGRRELYHFDHADPDESISMVTLDDEEARRVAAIVGGMVYRPQSLEQVQMNMQDLIIEWYRVEAGSPCVGKTIGQLEIRKRTGASIIAMVERDHSKRISPGPDAALRDGVTLVVAGEMAQVKALRRLLAQGVS